MTLTQYEEDGKDSMGVWAPRIIGIIAAFVAGKISERFHVQIDEASMTTMMLAVYAIVHRNVSKHTNPTDVASAHIAYHDKIAIAEAKASMSEASPPPAGE